MKKGRFVAIFYLLSFIAILFSRVDAPENLNVGALKSAMRTGDETVAKHYVDPAKKTQAKARD